MEHVEGRTITTYIQSRSPLEGKEPEWYEMNLRVHSVV